MSELNESRRTAPPTRTQAKVLIPDEYPMVSLLGSRDELLRVIEGAFRADIHVRGNEITVTGSPDESSAVVRLFEELVEVLRNGGELTADAVERSIAMLKMTSERPAEVLSLDILSSRGRTIRAPRPSTRSATSTRSTSTRSCSASAPPAPARPISRWPRPCGRFRRRRSTGSS
ncbi:hypothetical protein GCM10020219_081760 [Nonomuraea dietziae]